MKNAGGCRCSQRREPEAAHDSDVWPSVLWQARRARTWSDLDLKSEDEDSRYTKSLARQLVIVLAVSLVSAAYGDLPVAGVEVMVQKNNGSKYVKRAVTDAHGKFAIEGMTAGKYNIAFQPPKGTGKALPHKAVVGSAYSITMTGATKPFAQNGIKSETFAKGIFTTLELRGGAEIRGQVTAGKATTMVWIDKEIGSNIPGHWADANSAEAKAAGHSNTVHMSRDAVNRALGEHAGFHQEGWKGGGN